MPTPKIDPKIIFASNAPAQDKPAVFNNYTKGMDETRSNEGRPTIKQANALQQTTDQKILWIHENGGALPYDPTIDYVDGSIVLKDGELVQKNGDKWESATGVKTDAELTTWSGRTQEQENKDFVTSVNDYAELSALKAVDGRVAYVKKNGISGEFVFDSTSSLAVDGGTVIQGDNGKWIRKDLTSPNIEWWGALSTNTAEQNQSAYVSARNFGNTKSIKVELNSKTYQISASGDPIRNFKNGTLNKGGILYQYDNLGVYSDYRPNPEGVTLEYQSYISANSAPKATGYEKCMTALGVNILNSAEVIPDRVWFYGQGIAMNGKRPPSLNIGFGDFLMLNLDADDTKYQSGTRNIALGSLTLQHLRFGHRNTGVGRNTLACAVDSYENTAVGYNALAQGLSTGDSNGNNNISMGGGAWNSNHSGNTALGNGAGARIISGKSTFIGYNTRLNGSYTINETVVGAEAGLDLGKYSGYNERYAEFNLSISGTYNLTVGGEVTATLTSVKTWNVGDILGVVMIGTVTAEKERVTLTSVNGQIVKFKIVNTTASGSGTLTVDYFEKSNSTAAVDQSFGNSLVGNQTMIGRTLGQLNSAFGYQALSSTNEAVTLTRQTVAIGSGAGRTQGGSFYRCTILGANASNNYADGSQITTQVENSTTIGFTANISGSNQVQIGNSATTTYVYGTVQNRSDARDKADVRDTVLGLDFINSLRPVDYKWDMREDYIETLEDGTVIKHEKDGSKKRLRYHHGFIAQEVGALKYDFGGYQDHSLNGGCDVLSIGYDEFIAPLVKAVQELSKEVEELKKKLSSK